MKNELLNVFNEKQIEVIKDIINFGAWGSADQEFGDNTTSNYAYGFVTNLEGKGKYKGKEFSGICSGIAKVIKSTNCKAVKMISDFWDDGSGDIMFFNMDLLEAETKDLYEWAKTIQKAERT